MAGLLHILPAFRAATPEGTLGGSKKSPPTVITTSVPVKSSVARRKPTQTPSGPSFLSKIVRDANNYVLSWRDGLSESERSDRERIEERKQILAARMHNVSGPSWLRALCFFLPTPEARGANFVPPSSLGRLPKGKQQHENSTV